MGEQEPDSGLDESHILIALPLLLLLLPRLACFALLLPRPRGFAFSGLVSIASAALVVLQLVYAKFSWRTIDLMITSGEVKASDATPLAEDLRVICIQNGREEYKINETKGSTREEAKRGRE